jgi:hypothetical protein
LVSVFLFNDDFFGVTCDANISRHLHWDRKQSHKQLKINMMEVLSPHSIMLSC